jgi:hypothetical protein
MKKLTLTVLVALFAFAALFVGGHKLTAAQAAIPSSNPLVVNTVSLNFTTAQMVDSQTVRAFVPTGSKSVNCLATFNETNNVQAGTSLFCGEREPAAFGGTPGMLVSVFFSQPVTPDFVMSVTLYQRGAKTYGAPALCTGADGC